MTISLKLVRVSMSDKGTFGVFVLNGVPLCVTCEDPWNNNTHGNSCIPVGDYVCSKHSGPKFQNVWEVKDVPGRSAVLIHNGNTINDTEGCILVGKAFAQLGNLPSITESKVTLDMLRIVLPENFTLSICQSYQS